MEFYFIVKSIRTRTTLCQVSRHVEYYCAMKGLYTELIYENTCRCCSSSLPNDGNIFKRLLWAWLRLWRCWAQTSSLEQKRWLQINAFSEENFNNVKNCYVMSNLYPLCNGKRHQVKRYAQEEKMPKTNSPSPSITSLNWTHFGRTQPHIQQAMRHLRNFVYNFIFSSWGINLRV